MWSQIHPRTIWPSALLVALALSSASQSAAQSGASDKALAEALFDEGRKLMDNRDYAQACPKLERSQELDDGIGTLLYLADCYEKNGQLASAWATFREAASRARARGEAEREHIGVRRAGLLEPRLAKLTIVIDGGASVPGLSITRDAHRVEPELWGFSGPVDPGMHTLDASAPGKQPWHGSVTLADGEQRVVKIPLLFDAPASSPAAVLPSASTTEPPVAAVTRQLPAPEPVASGQRTVSYALGALGVAGLGVGAGFGFAARNKNDSASAHCSRPAGLCDAEGVAAGKDVEHLATASNIAFGVGAAALVGAVILYVTSPKQRSSAAAFHMSAIAGAGGGQIAFSGALP